MREIRICRIKDFIRESDLTVWAVGDEAVKQEFGKVKGSIYEGAVSES